MERFLKGSVLIFINCKEGITGPAIGSEDKKNSFFE